VACSKTDLVGTCDQPGPETTEKTYFYHEDGVVDDAGKATCDILQGTWTAVPRAKSVKPAKTADKKK
jgi:hypothetical protein